MTPLWLLLALAVTASAYFAGAVLIPLLFSLFLAILLEPAVAWCEARGLRRGRSSVLVVLVFLGVVAAAIWGCSQPFSSIAAEMPRYTEKFKAAAAEVDRRAGAMAGRVGPVRRTGGAAAPPVGGGLNSWSEFIWRGLGSIFEAAGIAAFVPFLMIVMLTEKEELIDGLKRLANGACDIGLIDRETTQMVRAYFYGNLLAGVGMGCLHWILFAALGLRNAVGLGLVAGLLTLIPLIGLPAALLLPTAQALLQFDRAMPFVLLASGMAALHLLNANYVVPRVIGGRVKINATAAMAGLLFWGWLWGVTGFVLAVPLTALLKVLFESGRRTGAYARLLAASPEEHRPWFGRRWLEGSRRRHRPYAPR